MSINGQGAASGAMTGAATGASVGGPWGALIGGVGGGLLGAFSGSNGLFGGTKNIDILTKSQKALLNQLGALQGQYNPYTYAMLGSIAGNPGSAYEYNADNGAAAFKAGVTDPALQQLNQQLADNQHSSMLHSSANRYAQDQLKSNTINNINQLQYQNQLQQQQAKQTAQENSYSRQLMALQQLLGGNQTVLGTQATAIQKQPGMLDNITGMTGAAQGIASLFK